MPDTTNRIALVTGAESGIGAACAIALAQDGADVAVLFHSDAQAAGITVTAVEATGRRAIAVQADVGDEAQVGMAFDETKRRLGVVDILVNSAGLNQSGVKVIDMDLAQWRRLLDTDLTGGFLTCRRYLRDRREAGIGPERPGRIINITSIHAHDVRTGAADYCAAKSGLARLTETLALETALEGVTVNAIAPGMILTPMNSRAIADPLYRKGLEDNVPAGRAGTPQEVGAMAVYLASDAAAYVTGASLVIDGGLSLVLALGA
jgi:glucose 1-dehydrogenase